MSKIGPARLVDRMNLVFLTLFLVASLIPFSARAKPTLDFGRGYWAPYLEREYGLSESAIESLRMSGLDWVELAKYLEQLYPHPPLAPTTEDFVKLASDTRITPTEAIKAYELAVVFRKDPKWIAEVYTQVRDWGRIESALEKYRQNIGQIKGLGRGTGKAQRSESVQRIAAVYRLSPQVIDGWAEAGVDPDVIGTVLFWLDVQASPSDHVYMLDQFLPKDWEMKAKPESKLKEHWPPRRFPSHRLPEINRLLDTAVPQTLTPTVTPIPTMPSFQLGSALESSLGPRSDDVAAPSYPQSYATPQSETAPPPSVIDPGAIYSTGHVSLFKAYFDSSTERVDPSTGALIIRQTDFVLPGRNGLDFVLARIYNSQKANTDLPRVRVEVDHYNIQAGSRMWYHDPNRWWL